MRCVSGRAAGLETAALNERYPSVRYPADAHPTAPMPPARARQGAPALTPGQKAAATRRRNAELRRQQQQQQAEDAGRARTADAQARFDLSDDAAAPVSTGQLRQSLSDFAATMAAADKHVEAISSKVDGLGSKLDALIARMTTGTAAGLSTIPEGATEDAAPLRGQYGECPPLSRRYGYIDEKLRGKAMAGTMAPEKLPLLLPVGSSLATRLNEDDDTFEVNGVTVTKKKVPDQAAVLAKFVRGIPKPSAFAAAWGVYTDLVLHGMGAFDAKTVADAHSALLSHGTWILEHAENFTWESCMSYHLTVANERKDGFSCGIWYKNFDGDAWGTIGVRKAATQPSSSRAHASQPMPGPRHPTTAAAVQAAPNAGRKDRACVNWNAGVCPSDPCPRGYVHACKRCRGPHVVRDCKNKPE